MKKSIKLLLIFIIILVIYIIFLGADTFFRKEGHSPNIHVSQEVIQVSVKANEAQLLKGLSADDVEDGDLTKQIQIESISDFDENMQRSITYLVFDSDDNMSKATRKLEYTDYEPPRIYLTKPLIYYSLPSAQELMTYVKANSKLDGDLSNQVLVNFIEKEKTQYIRFSVVDSAKQTSEITLKEDKINKNASIDIQLTDYLLYVKPYTEINAMSYVDSITYFGNKYDYLKNEIQVISNYDSSTPGTYEFIYQIALDNGEIGMSKLVVIVE